MGKINLTELPIMQSVQRKPVKFRGNTNSSEHNDFQETAYFDVTNIYNTLAEFKNELQEMSLAHSIDSAYTQMKIGNLPELVEQLQSEVDGLKYNQHRKILITPSKVTNSNTDPADINLQYGQINIPTYSSTSKLYLYDESLDLITIPSTLISSVTPQANGVDIVDTDFNNCIRGYENEYFIRKVIKETTEPVEMCIEVLLPDNIISNRDINALSIAPFPYAALDILNIEFMCNSSWEQIPGFTSHKLYSEDDNCIVEADNIKFCFSKLQMSKIRITLRQNNYIKEGTKNVFYLGIKNLSVTYDTVNQQMCTFMADINFGTSKAKMLHALTPKLNNENILSDQTTERKALFNFELYSVNKDGEKRHITDKFPLTFTDERLFVITNMYYDSNNDINPSLYKLEIEYDVQGDGGLGNDGEDSESDSDNNSNDNCMCILSGLVFNGDSIIIGADETSKPYKFEAACMLQGDCTVHGHVDKNIKYAYTIKEYGAGCRIADDTMIVNSTGTVVITCTASIGGAVISKDAIFTVEKIRKFTITYLSTNGGSIKGKKIQNIEKGLDGETVEAIPEYGYYFVEWSDGVTDPIRKETDVQSSAILTAKFELITYQVTFLAEDGSVIVVVPTKHGFAAEAPEPPEKTDYLFTGWSGPIDCITEDTTVTAQYTIKTYVVEFYNWDNTLMDSQVVIIHQDAVLPTDPTKEGWHFTGWSESTTGVTKDIKAYAKFEIDTFTVRFLNWDGALLSTQTIEWSSDATPPIATKEGWHFIGWDSDYKNIRSDRDITAQFEINVYIVKFVDHNGVCSTQNVNYGESAIAPKDPVRTGYNFLGWDKTFDYITENLTVTAQFEIKTFKVTVTKIGDGGTVIANRTTVEYGKSVTYTVSREESHRIVKHTINNIPQTSNEYPLTNTHLIENVSSDIDIVVGFEIKKFTVTWYNYDNTVIKAETVTYGTSPSSLTPPNYKEKGETYYFEKWTWNKEVEQITTNLYATATFKSKVKVEWYMEKNGSTYGALIKEQWVMPGEAITHPNIELERESYPGRWQSFSKWYPSYTTVTTDTKFYAVWTSGLSFKSDWLYAQLQDYCHMLAYTYPVIIGEDISDENFTDPNKIARHLFNPYNAQGESSNRQGETNITPRYIESFKYAGKIVPTSDIEVTIEKPLARFISRNSVYENYLHIEGLAPGETFVTFTYKGATVANKVKIKLYVEKIQPILKAYVPSIAPAANGQRMYTGTEYGIMLHWAEKKFVTDTLVSPLKNTKKEGNWEWADTYWAIYDDNVKVQRLSGVTVKGIKCTGTNSLIGNCGALLLSKPDDFYYPSNDCSLTYLPCKAGSETLQLTLNANTFNLASTTSKFNSAYDGMVLSHSLTILDAGVIPSVQCANVTSATTLTFKARCDSSSSFTQLAYKNDNTIPAYCCYPTPSCANCRWDADDIRNSSYRSLGYAKKTDLNVYALKSDGSVEHFDENNLSKFISITETTVSYSGMMYGMKVATMKINPKPSGYIGYVITGKLQNSECTAKSHPYMSYRTYSICVK